jgi:hypothetical protein
MAGFDTILRENTTRDLLQNEIRRIGKDRDSSVAIVT